MAAGLTSSASAQAEFIIGESTHNHGIDFGPIVSGYAGAGNYALNTQVGAPFGPTTVESSFATGTVAQVILGETELKGSVEKEINAFGYFAFRTAFTVDTDTDVLISWDTSTEVPWIDRRFKVWQSLGATLYEYDVNNGPHSGTMTVTLSAGQLYWVDALYRSIWDNGNGSFSITIPQDECFADLNSDGSLDFFDVSAFLQAFSNQDPSADFSNDGIFNFFDVSEFIAAFTVGCP
ncbi:MAG: GC-type dockerin domain-anchored protein [Phycisphaerales bacterium]|nr:GC-type dockerin domain-anchored protein [Phycisphaerales bacterium]